MSFGSGNHYTPRPLVETAQRVASPPSAGLARESVTLLVGGVPQQVEVVRQQRLHGQRVYWRCPTCESLRESLYVAGSPATARCRCCHKLDYRSRHVPRAVARAAKLRRKLGAAPGLLAPLPPRPTFWRPDYWARTVAELAAAERVLAEMLRGTVRALEKRKDRGHGRRPR